MIVALLQLDIIEDGAKSISIWLGIAMNMTIDFSYEILNEGLYLSILQRLGK